MEVFLVVSGSFTVVCVWVYLTSLVYFVVMAMSRSMIA